MGLINRKDLIDQMESHIYWGDSVIGLLEVVKDAPAVNAIEIPCDIGTIVYCTRPIVYNHKTHNGVKRGKVVGIEINEKKRKFAWVRFDFQPEGSAIAVGFKEFGVTAFISKDEAWNPLERREPDEE